MITVDIREEEEFIRLGQALKKGGVVESGVDAKIVVQNGEVKVEGEVETRRGRKLYGGEIVTYKGETISIVK